MTQRVPVYHAGFQHPALPALERNIIIHELEQWLDFILPKDTSYEHLQMVIADWMTLALQANRIREFQILDWIRHGCCPQHKHFT